MKRLITVALCMLMTALAMLALTACGDCEHEWGEWEVTVQSTCSEAGEKQRVCSECEKIEKEIIEAAEHIYDTSNITWTWNGSSAVAKLVCSADSTHTKDISAAVSDAIATTPTCTAAGSRIYTATVNVDGVTYSSTTSAVVSALGHNEVVDEAVSATCSSTGRTAGAHCSVCGMVLLEQEEIPKTNHATVTIEAIPATCLAEGATEGAMCYVCHEMFVVPQTVQKLSHTEQILPGVSATCENTGLTEGKKCTACQTVTVPQEFIDKQPHTEEIIHGTEPTCYEMGLSDGVKCSVCQEILVPQTNIHIAECDYVTVVTIPTCETEGYATHTCSMCGHKYTDSYKSAIGHTWSDWVASGESTVRNCTNACNCGKKQIIVSISAAYNGIRLLTGEKVWKDDVTVTATLSDGTTLAVREFTLANDTMTAEGSNYVDVKFRTLSAKVAVPAIYDNLPGATSAEEFTYTVKNDAVTITGFVGTSTEIVIPSYIYVENNRVPVRTIANSAFSSKMIESLVITDGITSIGNYSFENCIWLESVTFGKSLKTIGYSAFNNCISLTELVIPNNVTEIGVRSSGNGAFEDCTGLKKVTIGDLTTNAESVTVHARAFKGCTSLTDVFIGNRVTLIDEYAFYECTALQTFTTGSNVQTIGLSAFEKCTNLMSVTLTDSVMCIETSAFKECKHLSFVSFGSGLQSIGNYAFYKCESLMSAEFNSNITVIGAHAFEDCSLLTTLSIPFGETVIETNAFAKCVYLSNVDLGTSVKEIGSSAFKDCDMLTSITIPSSVLHIYGLAFGDCDRLSTVIIEKGNDLLRSFDKTVFRDCKVIGPLYYTGTSADWALIDIPENSFYPLNVLPYFYSEGQPVDSGNYWHYNKDGQVRVWGVSEVAFKAQEYSDRFVEVFGKESTSYATTFYNDVKNDSKLMAGIFAWEAIHITDDPSYIFNPDNSLISKKDLYKFTLYDIITGEMGESESFNFYDEASTKFILYVANLMRGGSEELITSMDMAYSVLSVTNAEDLNQILEKILAKDEMEVIKCFIDIAENAYEALNAISQYVALRQVKNGYVNILLEIYNDKSNPGDLRDAAWELAECYRDAYNKTLAEFVNKAFLDSTNKDVFKWAVNNAVGILAECDPTGILKIVGFTGNVIRAIAEPLKLDEFCQAYYQLKTSVGVEAALRKIIQNPLDDYLRIENKTAAENYMCAIEMYQNSVLYGFDYSIAFLTAYINSSTPDKDEIQTYKNLVEQLNGFKATKMDTYKTFDDVASQLYVLYCS